MIKKLTNASRDLIPNAVLAGGVLSSLYYVSLVPARVIKQQHRDDELQLLETMTAIDEYY
jgi:hypothetical protein